MAALVNLYLKNHHHDNNKKHITFNSRGSSYYLLSNGCYLLLASTAFSLTFELRDMGFKIPRTVQCAKCPWKISTNPHDIPDGYDVEKHKGLSCTIQSGLESLHATNAMACHHSDGNDQMYCIGWLYNQLGPGNNIGLRIKMMGCENARDIKIKGKQHEKFEDTLPAY